MTIKFKKNLSKKEIAQNIKSTIGFSKKDIQEISDNIIQNIIEILIDKKKINIKNFGSFKITYKKEREGRNPKTKEKFSISPRNAVKFKVSSFLKNKFN